LARRRAQGRRPLVLQGEEARRGARIRRTRAPQCRGRRQQARGGRWARCRGRRRRARCRGRRRSPEEEQDPQAFLAQQAGELRPRDPPLAGREAAASSSACLRSGRRRMGLRHGSLRPRAAADEAPPCARGRRRTGLRHAHEAWAAAGAGEGSVCYGAGEKGRMGSVGGVGGERGENKKKLTCESFCW
jgi:hypothetical protein